MASREDLDRIERDIADVRRDAGATIAALEERLSPGRLMDQALDLLRDRQSLRRIGDSLGDNVGPLLLIAAGVGWWAYNLSRHAEAHAWDEHPHASPTAPTPPRFDPRVLPDDLLGHAPAHKSAAESARVFRGDASGG